MRAVLNGVPGDDLVAESGLLDQLAPTFTVHNVERYWWRWEDDPDSDPQYLGQKRLGTTLRVPFPFDVTVRPIRIYMVTVTETGEVNTTQIKNGTQVVYPAAPTLTSAVFDTGGLDIDLVFYKNNPATGNIQVEYRKVGAIPWLTHATTFAHSATSGSITIAQEATSQTYQLRLKQVGIENYSRTIEVTVNGSSGADFPPTFTSVAYDSVNSEVDMVFAKVGTATGALQVEYKLTSDSTWVTHATTFAHGATNGSIVIVEAPLAQTFDIRMKQAGVAGYSTTRSVTVDAAPNTAPSNLIIFSETDLGDCETEIILSWTAGSGSDNYTVERKIGVGSWTAITSSVVGTSYTDLVLGSSSSSLIVHWRVKQNDVVGYSNQIGTGLDRCFL
jgi:hypothetical protein